MVVSSSGGGGGSSIIRRQISIYNVLTAILKHFFLILKK